MSSKLSIEEIKELPARGFRDRQIKKEICEFYGVKVSYGENGEIDAHYYPYDNGAAYKIRKLPKEFTWAGKSVNLFGQSNFNTGGRRLVITEGEIDALSVQQASYDKYKRFYPVVALSSATMTKSLLENRDWIRSFNEVVLCFDEDDAGRKAKDEAIKIIGIDKVKITKLPEKDANAVLVKHQSSALLQCIFDASPYIPSGIIGKEELWKALVEYQKTPSIPYPYCINGVNEKTKGARLGEIALFVSGTSCGKSTVMREIMLSMQEKTEDRIGIVSLEEAPAETARKLAGMALKRNPAAEEIELEELKVGFDSVFASDRYLLLDHQGSLRDETILDKLEYMALSGCKWVIIDHITILVSEGTGELTGNEAIDKTMNDLLRFVKRHNVWVGLVSHLRKTTNTGKAFEEGRMPNLDDIKGCLGFDTKVLLSTGESKAVQDIQIGDLLIDDNGHSTQVTSLCRGEQQMYQVFTKTTNDSFICNEDHVLTLSYNDTVFDIKVKDFLAKSENFKGRCKQHYSAGYELPERSLLIPPYSLGVWLGDGSKAAFRIMDASSLGIAERVAKELDAILKAPKDTNREYFNFDTGIRGEMLEKLKALNLYCNKHIPEDYILNTKKKRYELLAGLIDSDGTYNAKDNAYYFYQKNKGMAIAVKRIARSLGLYSNIRSQVISGEYASNGSEIFVVTISGDIHEIPAQKSIKLSLRERTTNSLKRGIIIEKLDVRPYYGFTLKGNGRFLLENHTITHNSGSIKQVSFDIIAFARNLMEPDPVKRNTIDMAVLKCRYTGLTGSVKGAYYDYEIGRFVPIEDAPQTEFVSLE